MGELDGCLLARFPGTAPPAPLRRWLDEGLGGVVLFAENITGPGQLRALTGELRSHNPGLVIAADEESGIVTRLEARTGSSYPGNAALGAAGDTALTRRVARSIGAMLAAAGVNLNLAPVADLDASPANPIIGVRSFGADPHQVAAHTAAFVDGIQASLVAACAKHFPGHGRADADSHLALPVVGASLRQLRETDLLPFRAAIEAGGPDGCDALIARGAGRALVLAIRDAHRHPWQRELISRALALRPDTIVVGTGTVHDRMLAGGRYLGTRGAGRANLRAAADVLLGPGPGPPARASQAEAGR